MSRPSMFEDGWSSSQYSATQWSSVLHQQWRVTSSALSQRQRTQKVLMSSAVDGTSLRSRPWANAYELSHDLHAKQVEILEKKYGGAWRSRHAATIIQRAYRHYCLTRNFAKLRWEADEKRLSRRFAEFSHSKTIWCDLASTIMKENGGNKTDSVYSEYDNVMSHSHSSDNMLHHFMSQKTARTFCQVNSRPPEMLPSSGAVADVGSHGVSNSGSSNGNPKIVEIPIQHLTENSYIRGHGHIELSDSGESVLNSPLEPMVDLPSECFESVLETQLVDNLEESFTSESDGGDTTPVNEASHSFERHDTTLTRRNAASSAGNASRSPNDSGTMGNDDDGIGQKTATSSNKPHDDLPNRTDTGDEDIELSPDGSPVWKRKSRNLEALSHWGSEVGCHAATASYQSCKNSADCPDLTRLDSVKDSADAPGKRTTDTKERTFPSKSAADRLPSSESLNQPKITDRSRKRAYRIGLNLFNKKPENGVRYLVTRRFLDHRPNAVAKFLISRKGLSKQMVGEYLGNLQSPFNMEVLRCFANEIELSGLQIDVALRKFQSYFRMPGEAQKIERLMEAFATRFCQCNPEHTDEFRSSETVFLLAFAIIMLNTDLHNSNIKPDRKMKVTDFVRNLRGIDSGQDIDAGLLAGVYDRIRASELKPGADHVSHVFRLEQMIFGNKPLSLPHRRLVCYCRMYEVHDPLKRDKVGQHQRELFLFNDVLMVTKLFRKKKKKTPLYSFRQMFSLFGMVVHIFESPYHRFGLRLSANLGGNVLIMLNARNEHDRTKFVDDLKESILEITEMEGLRIEEELKKQKISPASSNFARYSKDSGVVDVEMLKMAESSVNRLSAPECERLKKSPLSNSLVDITGNNRRGSGVSLDSGVASAESESVGSCQEPNRSGRFLGLPLPSVHVPSSSTHAP